MRRNTSTPPRKAARQAASAPKKRKRGLLPVWPVFFALTWLWAAWYYGDVFHVSREYSFWVADTRVMDYVLNSSFGMLRYLGRAMLQFYQYPWLGGLLLAFLLASGSWLLGYCMRLKVAWRPVQYIPAIGYMAVVTYHGLDVFFEARTGLIFGIPFLTVLVLGIWAVIIRSFSRKPVPAMVGIPTDETPRQNVFQLALIAVSMAAVIGFDCWQRPYVRVICRLLTMQYEQDWAGIQKLARKNADMSNRPMACSYAISLVQTQQIAERLYDIRLDYDSLHIHGMDGYHNNASCLYVPEGDYYGGFILSAMRASMEQMVMTGPTVRLLKLQIKCALMREEWELARKYMTLLRRVPFEGKFCDTYEPMIGRADLVNANREMALIRLTEPLHDSFESMYQQPLFMGYNLMLTEGRSNNALINSLSVCLYTKLMPQFTERLEPLTGIMPPSIILDGILLADAKHPGLAQHFKGVNFRLPQLQNFYGEVDPYMHDRPKYAKELFPKYKGYYPYYYYFGNLKATKKGYTSLPSSASGVN